MNYIKQWEQQFNQQLCNNYKYHLTLFTKDANFDILNANYANILQYISTRRALGDSIYALKNKVSSIKKYYQCLIDLEIIEHHPCKHLVLQDKYDTTVDFSKLYDQKTLQNFLDRKADATPHIEKRNQVIRGLLVYQALTIKEIGQLRIDHIDLDNATIQIKNSRKLNLNPKQMLQVYQYIEIHRKKIPKHQHTNTLLLSKTGRPLVIEHIGHMVNHTFTKKLLPKRIRQSVIYNLLKEGKDLRTVQLFAGHNSILSTERYLNNNFEELKSQLQLHHPLNHIK